VFAAIALSIYYVFIGTDSSGGEMTSSETNTMSSKPAEQSASDQSRTTLDRQRANHVGNAMNVNPSLDVHQKRVEDSQKMMEQITNSSR
jgi:hypothetical protein